MALAQARMLFWKRDACCGIFIGEWKHLLFFYLPCSVLAFFFGFVFLQLPKSFLSCQVWLVRIDFYLGQTLDTHSPAEFSSELLTSLWYLAQALLLSRLNLCLLLANAGLVMIRWHWLEAICRWVFVGVCVFPSSTQTVNNWHCTGHHSLDCLLSVKLPFLRHLRDNMEQCHELGKTTVLSFMKKTGITHSKATHNWKCCTTG